MSILLLVVFAVAAFALVHSGTIVVKALTRIAMYLRISEFTTAFLLMAFATSLPELLIAITSGLQGIPQLSLGNVVGANIANLTLAVGLPVLLARGIRAESEIVRTNAFAMAVLATLPLLLFTDGTLSRSDAIILFFGLLFYLTRLFRQRRQFHKTFQDHFVLSLGTVGALFRTMGVFVVGIIILLVSAEVLVRLGGSLARDLNLSLLASGIILLGIGTTLPELTFRLRAVWFGHPEMVLGDVMGTVVINSTLVIGTAAFIHPIVIENLSNIRVGILMVLLLAILFPIFLRTKHELAISEGAILVALYGAFLALELVLAGIR